jgi:hypothetical protein
MREMHENPIATNIKDELDERREFHEERARRLSSPVTSYKLTPEQLAELNARLERKPYLPPVQGGRKPKKKERKPFMFSDKVKNEAQRQMSDREIEVLIEEKGLKKYLSVKLVRKCSKEMLEEMIKRGLKGSEMAKEIGTAVCNISYLRKLFDMPADKKQNLQKKQKNQGPLPGPIPEFAIVKSEDPAPYTAEPAEVIEPTEQEKPAISSPADPADNVIFAMETTEKARIVAPLVVGVANSLVEMMCERVAVEIRVRRA